MKSDQYPMCILLPARSSAESHLWKEVQSFSQIVPKPLQWKQAQNKEMRMSLPATNISPSESSAILGRSKVCLGADGERDSSHMPLSTAAYKTFGMLLLKSCLCLYFDNKCLFVCSFFVCLDVDFDCPVCFFLHSDTRRMLVKWICKDIYLSPAEWNSNNVRINNERNQHL